MQVTYGKGFEVSLPQMMRKKVETLQQELSKLPQYEPETKHYFHGGMYCRKVFRHAGVLVVGAVHKKEHFYLIVSGTVAITDGEGNVQEITGPHLFSSKPGTKRAVYAVTDATCMTFHAIEAKTVDEAEAELVEAESDNMYSPGNQIKHQPVEVLP
jgi:hypothetical protein